MRKNITFHQVIPYWKHNKQAKLNLWNTSTTSIVFASSNRTGNSRISTLPSKSSTRKKSSCWELVSFNLAALIFSSSEQLWLNFSRCVGSSICMTNRFRLGINSCVFRNKVVNVKAHSTNYGLKALLMTCQWYTTHKQCHDHKTRA